MTRATTREDVVRAALEVFANHGYRGGSLDMVAAAVGVSRQGVLHYFPTKVKLLTAVLELRDREDTERFTALAEEHGWSLGEALGALLRHNAERPELTKLYTVLSAEAVDPDHPAHAWFVDRYRRTRAQLTEAIGGEQAAVFAAALVALLDGLQLQALLEPGAIQPEDALAAVMPILIGDSPATA